MRHFFSKFYFATLVIVAEEKIAVGILKWASRFIRHS